jgi:S-DNA-T family DNA segregation ATPase FtsK/SpoIIIE
MLYAPVGASKPIRVQGAFVSETEIEEIVDSIRAQSFGTTYSDDVMAQINRAAEFCGQKKGKGGAGASAPVSDGGADDNDPMLDSAIELAVECGKISTSLIQRRLQLGYGRAAKIIDMMERRGIVSAPEGQKPRTVLITREQFLEMQMNNADHADSGEALDEAPF